MVKSSRNKYLCHKVYSLTFRSTLKSKTREFQYKILNCIVDTNEKRYRFGLFGSPMCAFVRKQRNPSSIYPFRAKYPVLCLILKENSLYIETLGIILGTFDIKGTIILTNHSLLLGKYDVYSENCQK